MTDQGVRDTRTPAPGPTATGNAPRRADALRNHERVVTAARELFAERGLDVTVPEVAARAGVGRATVYRSYPTKEDLVLAVARDSFHALEERTLAALAADDAYRALVAYVPDLLDTLRRDRGLATAFLQARLVPAARLVDLIGRLVEAARVAGPLHPDAGALDVRIVLCGVVRQLIVLDEREPAVWRRYADVILAALRS
ncbi:helix-turn-helix domain containing protein [Micromonospora sp. WMMD1120]|uniref:TetR/AcrR family transcriptional regulator n=1 Tax=Micromonospora sp. WMMD1120 TaxID=3016106 RepID=UPI002415E730|nr:TetR/AcrR family transcriptional regulator [Micromonospora sp. WMMD1120]MDG4809049.1 helix-turn-helix domain containing protein [Micromonospora sp. WMMD1120]